MYRRMSYHEEGVEGDPADEEDDDDVQEGVDGLHLPPELGLLPAVVSGRGVGRRPPAGLPDPSTRLARLGRLALGHTTPLMTWLKFW